MTTKLYQEAILEADQLRKAAEANAVRTLVEVVTPRVREMVDRQILSEFSADETADDVLLGALGDIEDAAAAEAGVTLPDESGKVTLDLDTLTATDPVVGGVGPGVEAQDSDDELLLNKESAKALLTLREAVVPATESDFNSRTDRLRKTLAFSRDLLESDLGREKLSLNLLSRLCDKMLQETRILKEGVIGIGGTRSTDLDSEIMSLRKEIVDMTRRRKLTEMDVMMRLALPDDCDVALEDLDVDIVPDEDADVDMDDDMGDLDLGGGEELVGDEEMELEGDGLNEEDLMLKISGLPDDEALDLADLDVDIVDDEVGEEEIDADLDDLGDEAGEEDMGDMDFGALGDDEVVEIDEGMLRKELARMKAIAEGNADDPKVLDDFGGGKKERESFVDSDDSDLNKHDSVGTVKVEAATLQRLQKESRQNRALRKQAVELRRAVDKLTEQLKEQNLFNAKLLYVNKLVHSKALSERQLKSVVKSLDKAQTLREVRLLYKGFTDSLKGKKRKSKSLTESAHRSTGGSSRSARGGGSSERETSTANRWARLAGLPEEG